MILLIITVVAALGISFFCSLAEAVLLSINPLRFRTRGGADDQQFALWLELKNNVERPITAILVLNTVAHTGGAVLAGSAFEKFVGGDWLWAFSLTFMFSVLIGTEILPKVLGVHHSYRLAPWLGPCLRHMITVLRPVIGLTELVTNRLTSKRDDGANTGVFDIITLAQAAAAEKLIHSQEELIIIHAATLSARRVSSVMTPRDAVEFYRRDLSPPENVGDGAPPEYSRLPVSANADPDSIAAVVQCKDLLPLRRHPTWENVVTHPLPVFHPRQNLTEVLTTLLQQGVKMGQVRDDAQRFAGLVTLDDITRRIFGTAA